MNYSKIYKEYFDKLIDCRNKKIPSILYPPDYQGEEITDLPKDTATVIFTTGTTGIPKATVHTFESLENIIRLNTSILNINKDDVLANFLPTWTIGTYIYTVPTFLKGGKIIHDKFSPKAFQEALHTVPITTTLLIPTMLDMMKDSGLKFDLSNIRNVGVGAEQVNREHLEYVLDLGAHSVTHMYGSSEAIPLSLYNTFTSKEDIDLGLKEVQTFKYTNKDSLIISGISVSNNEVDTKDNFNIENNLYYWQRRTDNIVKKKGWKAVVEREFEILEREFPADIDPETMVWHYDVGDREVTILETGRDWKFEAEGRTPRVLREGDVVYVSKTTYHKIHKGKGNLKVSIKQFK